MFPNLKIIGRGTDPKLNNHTAIALDKSVLSGEMRKRVTEYETEFGEVKCLKTN